MASGSQKIGRDAIGSWKYHSIKEENEVADEQRRLEDVRIRSTGKVGHLSPHPDTREATRKAARAAVRVAAIQAANKATKEALSERWKERERQRRDLMRYKHAMKRMTPCSRFQIVCQNRGPDFICKSRVRNRLPDVPFNGKFLPCPFGGLERFIDYKPTSLEMGYKYDIQCEMDMGLNLDLVDPNTYKVNPNMETQLTEKDAILLEDEDSNAEQIKRSAQHSKVVPWMRKTQYISSEFERFGVAADRQEIKVGYDLKKKKENLNIFRGRQSQINLIKKSFENVKVPVCEHFSKKGVTAVKEIPILPDFEDSNTDDGKADESDDEDSENENRNDGSEKESADEIN
ncbi:hypothetical protein KIN20_011399 [Parelaphostrongylus tenuis]|uniref:RNA polymerase II-associated factor 1 homolog n=1 Tax=Parelaphostrongylus tenuis TaxID=148309 RepID=A0AAD5MTK9_PARTN|nr:hypothetical protein KIN20_011399 [Parelaphostrongylus tenuis]